MNIGQFIPKVRCDYSRAIAYGKVLGEWGEGRTGEVQLRRVREVWKDAVGDVPYYGRLVQEGRAPREISTWEDFAAIPELTREILQDRASEFVRRSGCPDLTRMTGGSTGNPVRFGVWHGEDEAIRMLKLVLWTRAGYQPGDRVFLIWGHSHLLGTGWRRHWNHLMRKGKDAVLGYRRVDAYAMNQGLCRDYAEQLLRYRPLGLVGYSAVLDYFVRALPEYHGRFHALGMKFVMPCAEPAPHNDSFGLLEKVFGCPVVQEFGGVDFGQVAMKFGDEAFEVFPEHNILEGVDDEGSDKEAAVVTALYRRYLPLIRYRQGDVLGGCRKLPHGHIASFERLEGRLNDMVILADGTSVHSVAVFHCIHQEAGVLNIQMILEDERPRILLVTRAGYDAEAEDRIRRRLMQVSSVLGRAKIETVADVEVSRAGKRRWFVDKRTTQSAKI